LIRTSYDPEGDALIVLFALEGTRFADTEEVAPGILLDFGVNGRASDIEVLDVRDRLALHQSEPAKRSNNRNAALGHHALRLLRPWLTFLSPSP
jgi:uncharacterized protein YuzE